MCQRTVKSAVYQGLLCQSSVVTEFSVSESSMSETSVPESYLVCPSAPARGWGVGMVHKFISPCLSFLVSESCVSESIMT